MTINWQHALNRMMRHAYQPDEDALHNDGQHTMTTADTWIAYQRSYRNLAAHPTTSGCPWPKGAGTAQHELPTTPPIELNANPASVLNQATDQPMPDHLNANERNEIELLLLRIFRQDADAIAFLSAHNHGLRAKPLELIQRDQAGVSQLLAYLRQAAANQPLLDPITRILK